MPALEAESASQSPSARGRKSSERPGMGHALEIVGLGGCRNDRWPGSRPVRPLAWEQAGTTVGLGGCRCDRWPGSRPVRPLAWEQGGTTAGLGAGRSDRWPGNRPVRPLALEKVGTTSGMGEGRNDRWHGSRPDGPDQGHTGAAAARAVALGQAGTAARQGTRLYVCWPGDTAVRVGRQGGRAADLGSCRNCRWAGRRRQGVT
jgi:hypothetical protein